MTRERADRAGFLFGDSALRDITMNRTADIMPDAVIGWHGMTRAGRARNFTVPAGCCLFCENFLD
jgi:hypothetical protein